MTYACDSSVLVPLLSPWHPHHSAALARAHEISAIPAHALLETFSVLTRLPPPYTTPSEEAAAVIAAVPWQVVALSAVQQAALPKRLAAHRISGGAVFDGLIGATAAHHALTLLTRDNRAERTYRALGVGFELV